MLALTFKKSGKKRYLLNKILTTLFILVFIFFSLTIFTVLRYRQLCSYDQAQKLDLISTDIQTDLCPNIFNHTEIPQIVANAFNLAITSTLQVKEQNTNILTQSISQDCNS